MTAALLVSIAAAAIVAAAVRYCVSRRLHIWLLPWVRRRLEAEPAPEGTTDIMVCVADHFEPRLHNVPYEQECRRVGEWIRRYPLLAGRHRDSDGRVPQHTFFYPEEEYAPEHLDRLAELCQRGFGDVEIHLHHDHDNAAGLRNKLESFKQILRYRHGLLHQNPRTGRIEYAFIHGNWALDNSDGGRNCGVDAELAVLRDTGCYADMTLPSAPGPAQTHKINSIYYAAEDGLPNSHDRGVDVCVGNVPSGDLMIVQGPLALNFRSRKWRILPKLENGELSGDNPPTPERVRLWIREAIHVKGRPNWIFIKLHTHGADERNTEALLGKPMDETLSFLEQSFNDHARYRLHYVTAREMYNIIKAAEAGAAGNAGHYRDFTDRIAAAASGRTARQ